MAQLRELLEQVEKLEDDAGSVPAVLCQFALAGGVQSEAIDKKLAQSKSDQNLKIGDLEYLHPDRKIGLDSGHARVERLAQRDDVAPLAHRYGEPERFLALVAELENRRIDEPTIDIGDVTQAKQPAAGPTAAVSSRW